MLPSTIDRDSRLPLYFQLKQLLLEKIDQDEWQPTEPIPSEQELQETHGLSRTTVRQALNELVFEGRLVRHRGKGTFVAPPKFAHSPDASLSLSEQMLRDGVTPGWQVLDDVWVDPPKDIQAQLQVSPEQHVLRMRRLRLANDQPIGYHIAYLPAAVAEQINHDALTKGDSLAYLRHLAVVANGTTQRVLEAVPAREIEAELLGSTVGDPMMLIQRLTTSGDGQPVEYMKALYRGDRFKYQLMLPNTLLPTLK